MTRAARLVRIVRRGSGSVVTWRRAQMVLLSAQGMDVAGDREGGVHQRRPGPRCLYPASVRIAIICDDFSPHLSTHKDCRVGTWAAASNVEIACTPTSFVSVKPHRDAIHGAAVLRAGRHRPRQPRGAGQHDPPVHHLAQQPRLRRTTPRHRRQGKHSLMRHGEQVPGRIFNFNTSAAVGPRGSR